VFSNRIFRLPAAVAPAATDRLDVERRRRRRPACETHMPPLPHATIFSDRNLNQHHLYYSPHRPDTRRRLHPTHTPPLLFMDRLIEAVAEYLCQHRSVGLLRLTLDLTRRRLDLFAEIGAVEVVKGVVVPPTPGTDAVVACRRRRQRGRICPAREGACPVREGGRGGQLGRPAVLTTRRLQPRRRLKRWQTTA
jgi:hypothetical protein